MARLQQFYKDTVVGELTKQFARPEAFVVAEPCFAVERAECLRFAVLVDQPDARNPVVDLTPDQVPQHLSRAPGTIAFVGVERTVFQSSGVIDINNSNVPPIRQCTSLGRRPYIESGPRFHTTVADHFAPQYSGRSTVLVPAALARYSASDATKLGTP